MTEKQTKILDWTLTVLGIAILIMFLIYSAHSQDKESHELNTDRRQRLTIAFQRTVLSQTQWVSAGCNQLMQKVNADSTAWGEAQKQVAKEMALPEGTTFKVKDLDKMDYEVVQPPPAKVPPPNPTQR